MNYVELIRSWNIPENATLCSCWCISSPKETFLYPDMINKINIPFQGRSPTHLLQVKNHMNDKPWKIINEYIYFNEQTHLVTIPIITPFFYHLNKNEPICHVRLTSLNHPLHANKGNLIKIIFTDILSLKQFFL